MSEEKLTRFVVSVDIPEKNLSKAYGILRDLMNARSDELKVGWETSDEAYDSDGGLIPPDKLQKMIFDFLDKEEELVSNIIRKENISSVRKSLCLDGSEVYDFKIITHKKTERYFAIRCDNSPNEIKKIEMTDKHTELSCDEILNEKEILEIFNLVKKVYEEEKKKEFERRISEITDFFKVLNQA